MSEGPIRRWLKERKASREKVLICPTCGNEMKEELVTDIRYKYYLCPNCGTKVQTAKGLGHW